MALSCMSGWWSMSEASTKQSWELPHITTLDSGVSWLLCLLTLFLIGDIFSFSSLFLWLFLLGHTGLFLNLQGEWSYQDNQTDNSDDLDGSLPMEEHRRLKIWSGALLRWMASNFPPPSVLHHLSSPPRLISPAQAFSSFFSGPIWGRRRWSATISGSAPPSSTMDSHSTPTLWALNSSQHFP